MFHESFGPYIEPMEVSAFQGEHYCLSVECPGDGDFSDQGPIEMVDEVFDVSHGMELGTVKVFVYPDCDITGLPVCLGKCHFADLVILKAFYSFNEKVGEYLFVVSDILYFLVSVFEI